MEKTFFAHPFGPFFSSDSEILILGSFPSPKSRESAFYYGNKNNRFWKILSALFLAPMPETLEEKKRFLIKNKIALFDSIESLTINNADDSSISNAKISDIRPILENAPIRHIYCNGRAAYDYFLKMGEKRIPATYLASSSAANASFSLPRLIERWKIILEK